MKLDELVERMVNEFDQYTAQVYQNTKVRREYETSGMQQFVIDFKEPLLVGFKNQLPPEEIANKIDLLSQDVDM